MAEQSNVLVDFAKKHLGEWGVTAKAEVIGLIVAARGRGGVQLSMGNPAW